MTSVNDIVFLRRRRARLRQQFLFMIAWCKSSLGVTSAVYLYVIICLCINFIVYHVYHYCMHLMSRDCNYSQYVVNSMHKTVE